MYTAGTTTITFHYNSTPVTLTTKSVGWVKNMLPQAGSVVATPNP
jgi:hypothetical protein